MEIWCCSTADDLDPGGISVWICDRSSPAVGVCVCVCVGGTL